MKFLYSFRAQYVYTQVNDPLDSKPMVELGPLSLSIAVKTAVVAVAKLEVINSKEG
jgi:hypothetical protein